jgi:hypothetical protein
MLKVFNYIFLIVTIATTVNAKGVEHLDIVKEIRFSLVEGMIIINANINGVAGDFIFDTGSAAIFVHEDSPADKDLELSTVEGSLWASKKNIDRLELAEIVVYNIPALGIDLSRLGQEIGQPIAGIIGWSFFGSNAITIDYKNEILIIGDQFRKSGIVDTKQYHILKMKMETAKDDLPIVKVNVRDQALTFAFDTGAPLNIIDRKKTTNTDAHIGEMNAVFEDVIFLNGSIRIENSLFRVENLTSLNNGEGDNTLDGILSVNSLNAEKIVLDRDNQRIFIFWDKSELNKKVASL